MIEHIKCDIFESGADVILHQVNCQGAMNSGIAKQVREKFPVVFNAYNTFCSIKDNKSELLGTAQFIRVDEGGYAGYIVNLFAQENFGYDGKCYTDYAALRKCLEDVNNYFDGAVIAIPYRIGCARGGGDWNVVYQMIEEIFDNNNVLICECDRG